MDAYDDELDLAAEDALLFGDEEAPPALELKPAVPRRHSPELTPRVLDAWRRGDEESDRGEGDAPEPDELSDEREREPVTSEPLYVDPDVPQALPDSRPAARGELRDAAVKARAPQRVAPRAAAPPKVATRATAPSGRSVAVVGALAAAAVAVGALVLPSLGGEESRNAAVASPVPSATPAPVTRTVTVTVPRREKAKRSAPTSPRPKPAWRVRAKRPQVVRRPAAPAAAAAPVVRSAPVYRPPVYRVPSAGRSADAAFGVRTP